jgi:hypothetical protein
VIIDPLICHLYLCKSKHILIKWQLVKWRYAILMKVPLERSKNDFFKSKWLDSALVCETPAHIDLHPKSWLKYNLLRNERLISCLPAISTRFNLVKPSRTTLFLGIISLYHHSMESLSLSGHSYTDTQIFLTSQIRSWMVFLVMFVILLNSVKPSALDLRGLFHLSSY